ncbi:MAG: helix-turn-helix transcriptional regulator [Lachnospiraceae bacterium]|nr:helix-turn-helix transcriptional regulator [Lachnospiraceae bacterium]
MTLGNKIQEIRNARGMSQEQFGEMLGTTRQTVSKWELDQVVPDIRKIVAISKLFCVPTEELLLKVTTFENEGVRFACGVYRDAKSEIVETEKVALYYYCNDDKSVMGAKVYEGNGDVKRLVAVCERLMEEKVTYYAYSYEDDMGTEKYGGNSERYKGMLGEDFDRARLAKMECLERFYVNHGDVKIHTVKEAGIRQCLEEWRKGMVASVSEDCFFINLCTGKTEYIYQIHPLDDNIYCGISYNIPFELGLRSYGQFFRLRNYGDNSQSFCGFRCNFSYRMPEEEEGADYVELGGNTDGSCGWLCWFVKRYKNEEIVLDGCGGEDYIFRRNEDKLERFA